MNDAQRREDAMRARGHDEAARLYRKLRLHSTTTDDPAGALMWDAANMIAQLILDEPLPEATVNG